MCSTVSINSWVFDVEKKEIFIKWQQGAASSKYSKFPMEEKILEITLSQVKTNFRIRPGGEVIFCPEGDSWFDLAIACDEEASQAKVEAITAKQFEIHRQINMLETLSKDASVLVRKVLASTLQPSGEDDLSKEIPSRPEGLNSEPYQSAEQWILYKERELGYFLEDSKPSLKDIRHFVRYSRDQLATAVPWVREAESNESRINTAFRSLELSLQALERVITPK